MAEKEYIERGALMEEINRIGGHNLCEWGTIGVKALVERQPAADVVKVRHARWKDNHCTACGMMPMGEEIWDSCEFAPPKFEFFMYFCPHCGAKMDGEREEK